ELDALVVVEGDAVAEAGAGVGALQLEAVVPRELSIHDVQVTDDDIGAGGELEDFRRAGAGQRGREVARARRTARRRHAFDDQVGAARGQGRADADATHLDER